MAQQYIRLRQEQGGKVMAQQYIRLRQEPNMIILESIHKDYDTENIHEWDCINLISRQQLVTFPAEEIENRVQFLKVKMFDWINTGLYDLYPEHSEGVV